MAKTKKCSIKSISKYLLIFVLSWNLVSCATQPETSLLSLEQAPTLPIVQEKIAEVSPPSVIQQLRSNLDSVQPEVSILSPQKEQVLQESQVKVQLLIKNYKIFQDRELLLGPHLELIVDNQPKQSIYSVEQPITLENLTPGTHTLRVFAVTPWGESFKNEGAYTQTTFHLYSKTSENSPDLKQPILTYNQPQGDYGASPILLDFYLANAPLHVIAQENKEDNIEDWRIKVTINGESFYLDRWEPIFLKGFVQGKNWLQIEYVNEKGLSINNAFNSTVRVINYQPEIDDNLSKLIQDQIPLDVARAIIDPDYKKPSPPAIEEVTTEPLEEVTPEPIEVTPEPIEVTPEPLEEVTPEPLEEVTPEPIEVTTEPIEVTPEPLEEVTLEPIEVTTEPIEVTPLDAQ